MKLEVGTTPNGSRKLQNAKKKVTRFGIKKYFFQNKQNRITKYSKM